jgi:hypothetical protein
MIYSKYSVAYWFPLERMDERQAAKREACG